MIIISSSGEERIAENLQTHADECGELPETPWLMRIWTPRGIGVKVYEEISEQTRLWEFHGREG